MTWAVAAWSGTGHAVCLPSLPCELCAIHVAVFLPLGSQRTTWCAAMRCILPCHVTLSITTRYRTPKNNKTSPDLKTSCRILLSRVDLFGDRSARIYIIFLRLNVLDELHVHYMDAWTNIYCLVFSSNLLLLLE